VKTGSNERAEFVWRRETFVTAGLQGRVDGGFATLDVMFQRLLLLIVFVTVSFGQQSNKGWYSSPAIHADTIAFTSEGDLWLVGVHGGLARRPATIDAGNHIEHAPLNQAAFGCNEPHGKTLFFARLDIAAKQDSAIPIELPSDFDSLREEWVKNPIDYLSSVHLAPDGNSIVLTARGRVFVAPAKQGRFVDVSERAPGRFREVRMMPDGKSVVMLSTDRSNKIHALALKKGLVSPFEPAHELHFAPVILEKPTDRPV